jgi:hypothetical protein
LYSEQPVVRHHVHHLHVVGDDVLLEALLKRGGQTGLEVEQQLVRQCIDVQVALHSALRRHQSRVAALAGLQAGDVVGHLAIQQSDPVGAQQAQSSAKAQVENAGGLVQGRVFATGVAVICHDLSAADFGEAGAERRVQFVEGQRSHRN